MRFKLDIDGQVVEIEALRQGDQVRITRDGHTVEARLLYRDGPYFVLEYQDAQGRPKRLRAAGLIDGDRRQLWVEGRMLRYERARERAAHTQTAEAASLSPSIPAVVTEVLVRPGDRVAAGQRLILLESMKMVMPIQAPYTAEVVRLNCQVGDAVQPGMQLVELAELKESPAC